MKKMHIVCMMFCVIMALCAAGCNRRVPNQNQAGVNTGSGSQQQEQHIEGSADVNVSLPFRGWTRWGDGLTVQPEGNTATFNGRINSAGYVTTFMDPNLRNRTIGLSVQNADQSTFSDDRMIKITVNAGDQVVEPSGIRLLYDEYVPSEYEWIEFTLPNDFDGKLGFVFYQATLNNLQITAYHN